VGTRRFMAALWNHLRQVWTNTDWSWIVLWLGLTLLIIALIVLMRTRWGQSRPLGKCAVLSLVAHLLLAIYATTVQIVTGSAGRDNSESLWATLVDVDEAEDVAQRHPLAQPAVATNSDPLWSVDSQPPRVETSAQNLEPTAKQPDDQNQSASPSQIEGLAPGLTATDMPRLDKLTGAPPAAESIDAPQPAASAAADVVPEIASPSPLAVTPSPSNSSVGADTSGDQSAQPTREAGLSDPLGAIGLGAQSLAGDGSPFRALHAPVPANAASDERTDAASTTSSVDGARSLLVPVKTNNATGEGAVPQIYKDRTAGDRTAIARSRGGSPESEAAVQAALKWLAANQSADGRWDADRFGAGEERNVLGHDRQGAGARADTATTGLALLAFLGAGHTHLKGEYKETVKRGLEHVLGAQAADGNLGGNAELFAFMYSHGIATLSLSEAYAMTRDRRLEPALRAAVAYTVAAQNRTTGGWRYRPSYAAPSDAGDTSQLGWQLMALKSAELSGIPIQDHTRAGMLRFLQSVSSGAHGGLASYRPREGATRAMTAEALVCRQFLGMSRDNPAANEAGDYLLADLPSDQSINLYYWYYGTLAMYQLQGEHWRRWNEALQKTLIESQVSVGGQAGSWDPDCIWAGYGGRVYSTAMASLCLEVYYRYLPLYGEFGPATREAKRP
jgi:hypothetical protein